MTAALQETAFRLPGQIGDVHHGKVADTYVVSRPDEENDLFVAVRSDRVSSEDVVLQQLIPHKGAVLNQMSAELLADTVAAPSWFLEAPDPNVSIGLKAEPLMVEMIMRGRLLGSAWKAYSSKAAMRDLCGHQLPDGMQEYQPFDTPLLTPTTKENLPGQHDENITLAEIVWAGLATSEEVEEMEALAAGLFAEGQAKAAEKGLELVDTKYEFGKLANGQIVVIDEIHTPDSSRYFYDGTIQAYLDGEAEAPEQLSKEFVRKWLRDNGFEGTPDGFIPTMPEDFIEEVTRRYVSLYEQMTGKHFEAPTSQDPAQRIETNILEALGK